MVARAPRRPSPRTDERGATLFIVLMIIMILSAIGTFAVNNSRFETQTSGFERQRMVTNQLVSFGAYAAMNEIGAAPQAYSDLVKRAGSDDPSKKERCAANAGLVTGLGAYPACYHIYLRDIERRLSYTGLVSPPDPDLGLPGSLGLGQKTATGTKSGMNGGFVAEVTEPYEYVRPMAGYPIDGSPGTPTFVDFTVTSNAFVFYDLDLNGVIDPTERGGSTYAVGRGHMIVGPIFRK